MEFVNNVFEQMKAQFKNITDCNWKNENSSII